MQGCTKSIFFAHDIKKRDLNSHDSHTACNEAGRVSIEGKEYVIKDGDIVHFRYNVKIRQKHDINVTCPLSPANFNF